MNYLSPEQPEVHVRGDVRRARQLQRVDLAVVAEGPESVAVTSAVVTVVGDESGAAVLHDPLTDHLGHGPGGGGHLHHLPALHRLLDPVLGEEDAGRSGVTRDDVAETLPCIVHVHQHFPPAILYFLKLIHCQRIEEFMS